MNASSRQTRIPALATRRRVKLAALAAVLAGALLSAAGPAAATTSAPPAAPLQLIAEPQAGITPFLNMIIGARTSIDLTMYELFDRHIEQALAAAAKRGVDVRVLLNGGYYQTSDTTNEQAYAYLADHSVHVRHSPTYFALTHQKTLTVDGRESAIMTLNFDGLYSSTRDFAILDTQPADIRAITEAFDADYSSRRTVPSAGTGDLVWSPGAAAQSAVLKLIGSARNAIELEDEEMDYPAATRALCQAARRGVQVRIVMTAEATWARTFAELRGCGASIHLYHGQAYYIHAKLLLVDGRAALVSSQNLSTGSLEYNRELGITVTTPAILTELADDFANDYASA
jgi:cardiolipin synthase